jgi:spermidine synthase
MSFAPAAAVRNIKNAAGSKKQAGTGACPYRIFSLMKRVRFLDLVTFISAFLLFQIELIIAKIFLPNYGGSYLVWGSCIVFFQAALLLGYLYSHFVIRHFGIARYRFAHLGLMLLPLLFFPGRPISVGYGDNPFSLSWDVFYQLLITIGPVFFVLSTISLVTQTYLSRSDLPSRDNPYALYAVSNFGSFAALLTYPFVFEFFLPLSQQLLIWRILYFLLTALYALVIVVIPVRGEQKAKEKGAFGFRGPEAGKWLFLGAGGVIMFLSVNNIVTIKVAPLPLLWILPLSIYLLAFVLNFKKTPWCPSWIRDKAHITLGFSALLYFLIQQSIFPVTIELALLTAVLFILCMYCQNQLIRLKPQDESDLTAFYVVISLGSFIGGIMTSWVIPLLSDELIEYLIGLIIIAMTLPVSGEGKKHAKIYYIRMVVYFTVFMTVWPIVFYEYNVWALLFMFLVVTLVYGELAKVKYFVVISLACLLCVLPYSEMFWRSEVSIYKKRNYYGTMRIVDVQGVRLFYHGTTLHGSQSMRKGEENLPMMYYDAQSPVAEVMTSDRFDFKTIATVGLGAGMIATYTRPGQALDFYELDPDVGTVAQEFFTYTKNASARITNIYGDARLLLDKNRQAKYDLIVIDAFGSDAIPVHLLTVEMIAKYREHLNKDGILLFHISNRYLELSPVLARIAYAAGTNVCYKLGQSSTYTGLITTWVVMTWDDEPFTALTKDLGWGEYNSEAVKKYRPWSDDYSSVLSIIKGDALIGSVKQFNPFSW